MKTYKGVIKKSRTLDAAALIAVLGVIEANFGLLREMLGEHYGISYIAIAAIMAWLRVKTTGPVGDKDE